MAGKFSSNQAESSETSHYAYLSLAQQNTEKCEKSIFWCGRLSKRERPQISTGSSNISSFSFSTNSWATIQGTYSNEYLVTLWTHSPLQKSLILPCIRMKLASFEACWVEGNDFYQWHILTPGLMVTFFLRATNLLQRSSTNGVTNDKQNMW